MKKDRRLALTLMNHCLFRPQNRLIEYHNPLLLTLHSMKDKTRSLSDFKWCVQSPPLMRFKDDFRWPPEAWFETRELAFEFTPTSHEYKLGLRFEEIIAGWIEQEPSLNLLAKNLTIHDKKKNHRRV